VTSTTRMLEKDSSEEPFLENQDDSLRGSLDEIDERLQLQRQSKQLYWLKLSLVILYVPAIVLFVLSYTRWSTASHPRPREHYIYPDMIPFPALKSNAVKFEVRRFPQNFRDSVFAGDPSEELDLAWHNLFEDNNIRVEKADLDTLGLDSVQLADGGYIAQLGVFHELHCLKKVRHWIFRDYYVAPLNISQAEWEEWPPHINHCLEMLRVAIMCRGDVSLSTFKWIGTSNHRVPTAWDRSPHQCVNWDSLAEWTRSRSVNISAPGTLIDEQGRLFP